MDKKLEIVLSYILGTLSGAILLIYLSNPEAKARYNIKEEIEGFKKSFLNKKSDEIQDKKQKRVLHIQNLSELTFACSQIISISQLNQKKLEYLLIKELTSRNLYYRDNLVRFSNPPRYLINYKKKPNLSLKKEALESSSAFNLSNDGSNPSILYDIEFLSNPVEDEMSFEANHNQSKPSIIQISIFDLKTGNKINEVAFEIQTE